VLGISIRAGFASPFQPRRLLLVLLGDCYKYPCLPSTNGRQVSKSWQEQTVTVDHHFLHSTMEKTGENCGIIISNTAVTSPSLCGYCNLGYTHGGKYTRILMRFRRSDVLETRWNQVSGHLVNCEQTEMQCLGVTHVKISRRTKPTQWWSTRFSLDTYAPQPLDNPCIMTPTTRCQFAEKLT